MQNLAQFNPRSTAMDSGSVPGARRCDHGQRVSLFSFFFFFLGHSDAPASANGSYTQPTWTESPSSPLTTDKKQMYFFARREQPCAIKQTGCTCVSWSLIQSVRVDADCACPCWRGVWPQTHPPSSDRAAFGTRCTSQETTGTSEPGGARRVALILTFIHGFSAWHSLRARICC